MSAKLKAERPKAITVLAVRRTRRFIHIDYMIGDERCSIQSKDNPLPKFTAALDALAPLVGIVCEVAPSWCTGLRVMGIVIGQMRDARTVRILVQKPLVLAISVLSWVTPAVLLATPATEGIVSPPLKAPQADLVHEVIEQSKHYIKGDRAQGQLDFGGDDDDDEIDFEDDEKLPLFEPPSGPPKKSRSTG